MYAEIVGTGLNFGAGSSNARKRFCIATSCRARMSKKNRRRIFTCFSHDDVHVKLYVSPCGCSNFRYQQQGILSCKRNRCTCSPLSSSVHCPHAVHESAGKAISRPRDRSCGYWLYAPHCSRPSLRSSRLGKAVKTVVSGRALTVRRLLCENEAQVVTRR